MWQHCDLGLKNFILATDGNLTSLNLSYTNLTSTVITREFAAAEEVRNKMKKIVDLDLSYCINLTEEGLKKINLATGGDLVKLDLRNHISVNLNALTEKEILSRLTRLTLLITYEVDDMKLKSKLPNLEIEF